MPSGKAAYTSPRHSDRKSTRLNSSHANISNAVFCLKKKIRIQLNILERHLFFNDTATTEIYTLSLHDALPISPRLAPAPLASDRPQEPRPSRRGRCGRRRARRACTRGASACLLAKRRTPRLDTQIGRAHV